MEIFNYSQKIPEDIIKELGYNQQQGLHQEVVFERLKKFGINGIKLRKT